MVQTEMYLMVVIYNCKTFIVQARENINFRIKCPLLFNEAHFARTSGLYYKRITIVIDAPSVFSKCLQIVTSLKIVIDDAS